MSADWYTGIDQQVYVGVRSVMPGVNVPHSLVDWVLNLVANEGDISKEAWEAMRPLSDAQYQIARIGGLSHELGSAFWALALEQERVVRRAIRARRAAQATIVVLEILKARVDSAAAWENLWASAQIQEGK